jgi:hypothetical protein
MVRKRVAQKPLLICAVITLYALVGCNGSEGDAGNIPPSGEEKSRITSPDGQLDAVLVVDAYGPAAGGGVDSDVYITTKGTPLRMKSAHTVFRADPLRGGSLAWKTNHLLEIHYDIAGIHEFRNLWGLNEVQNVGSTGERDFLVEIRLAPSSPDFSLLTPNGDFRPRD